MYQGVIVDVPQEKAKTYLCKLRIDKEMSERGMVPVNRMILVYIMKDSLSVNLRCGDHLNFYTRISTPEREVIPGEFDYAAYLFRQQISGTAVIFPGYWQWTGKKSALTWKQRAGVWREKILDSYRKWGFSGDEFAVLSALTVGYKEELSEDLRETYQVAGVSHILALSGMHIAVLWGLLCWILRPLDRSCLLRWVKCGIIVLLLWTFAFLVGLPPSVIRAVVMCMLMTAARAAGERTLSLNTLSVAAFFMLLYNPFYLFDTGFQLSFLAVLSILFIYPVISRCWRVRHPVPRYIWGIVAVSLAAQLGTAPVVIYKFAYFPVYFLPANLIVAPLVLVIIYGTVASFVLSPFTVLHIWVVKGLNGVLRLLNDSMQWVGDLPVSHSGDIHLSLLQVGILYVLLFVVLSYLLSPSRKSLITVLCGINLFIGFSGCLYYMKEESFQLILAHSQVKVSPQKVGIPSGYIEMAGQVLTVADYPDLFNVLNGKVNVWQSNGQTVFQLPISIDGFFRHVGGYSNPVGIVQGDASIKISGIVGIQDDQTYVCVNGAFYYHSTVGAVDWSSGYSGGGFVLGFDSSRCLVTGARNAPAAINFRAYIKY
jgi:competence protein ComEC